MNVISRFFSIALSISLLILIFELVRRRKLKEKHALLWLLTGFVIFAVTVFQNLLSRITHFFGISLPINTLFLLGILFLIVINIYFSLVISNLAEQNKKLAQKLALLEIELNNFIHKL